MPKVELVYDDKCPNVPAAQARLGQAFAELQLEPRWQEWRTDDPEAPSHVRGYGSPTVLVDGRDVGGSGSVGGAPSCRVYAQADGALGGAPPLAAIVAALTKSRAPGVPVTPKGEPSRVHWKTGAATLPAIGFSALPKVACPACWPAYAGFLSSVGLGFLLDDAFLLPLTGVFLAIAIGALAFWAKRRRNYRPLWVGMTASAMILVGKFIFDSNVTMYVGIAVLVGASVWNSWPLKTAPKRMCQLCE